MRRQYKLLVGYFRGITKYFIPCHRKYLSHHNQCDIAGRTMGRLDVHVEPSQIQRLSCVLIGCIFDDMIQNLLFIWNVIMKQLLPFLPEYSIRQPTEVLPFLVKPEKLDKLYQSIYSIYGSRSLKELRYG